MNDRLRSAIDMLQREHVDLLVCRLPENVVFLSGYWPNTGDSLAVLTQQGESAIFIPMSDSRYAAAAWVDDVVTTTASELDRFSAWLLADTDAMVKWVSKRFRPGIVGYEGSFETVAGSHIGGEVSVPSVGWKRILEEHLAECSLKDITAAIYRERMTKTGDELQRIRRANLVASKALDTIIPQVRPGLKECQVAAMIESMVQSEGYGFQTAFRARGFAFVQSGPINSANGWWPFSISSERVIEKGDSVLIELDAHVDGYWCDLTRSFVVGDASEAQIDMRGEVLAAYRSVLEALGSARLTCSQLDNIARQSLRRRYLPPAFPHKLGHGVGFAFHEFPLLHPNVHDEIPIGAVLAIEPGLYVSGVGGYRLEDNVYIGEDGIEVLTTAHIP